MHGGDGYFDERVAARYDESDEVMVDAGVVEPVIDFLVEIAGSGRALELGIGAGRIALPLALRGMRLRERWGGWAREPFTSDSRKHVSVWEKLAV